MSETLEAIARALFKSWFVDFDPVRLRQGFGGQVRAKHALSNVEGAKARRSAGSGQTTPGLPERLAELFPDSFEDSELGEIPKGWRVISLGEMCGRVAMGPFGSDIKTDNFIDSGVPVIRGGNLTRRFVDEGFAFVSEAKADELRNANAFPGDSVITHRGTLGQVGFIPLRSRLSACGVQSQMLLSVNLSSQLHGSFTIPSFAGIGQHALLANTSQTGVPAIARPTTSLRAIRLLLPARPVLVAFEKRVGQFGERAVHATEESRRLAKLRDALLPKLISGELRVKHAERFVAEATSGHTT